MNDDGAAAGNRGKGEQIDLKRALREERRRSKRLRTRLLDARDWLAIVAPRVKSHALDVFRARLDGHIAEDEEEYEQALKGGESLDG